MKKTWRKRILYGFLVVLLLIGGAIGVMYYMSGARPDWYRNKKLSDAEVAQFRRTAEDKLKNMQGWAQAQAEWPKVSARPRVDTDPTTAPAETRTLTISEDELNALLAGWEQKLLEAFGQYISEPYLGLRDGHLIAAVKLKDAGRVLSVHVQPRLDDKGMLTLPIDSLQAGIIPVPRALWSSYTDKLAELIKPKVEDARTKARYEGDGVANGEAVSSSLNRLLLQSLKDQSSDAVLFLPSDPSHWSEQGYPAKVTAIKIENQSLTLTLAKLTPQEQQHLLARIRSPYGQEPDPPIAAPVLEKVTAAR